MEDLSKHMQDILGLEARIKFLDFMMEEIEAKPEEKKMIAKLLGSDLASSIFRRGFAEGASWVIEDKKGLFKYEAANRLQ